MTIHRLSGPDAEALLLDQIGQHSGGIKSTLPAFDANSATSAWMAVLRGIEEFINIPMFGLDGEGIVRRLAGQRLARY